MRLAAIGALGATGQPSAQDALVRALGSDSGEEREAAASALGSLGTVAAVGPLRAAVGAHPQDRGLRSAATRAIAAVQVRAGAEPGGPSLADEPDAGALSLADQESGRLGLSPTEADAELPGPALEPDDAVQGGQGSDRSKVTPPDGVGVVSRRTRRT